MDEMRPVLRTAPVPTTQLLPQKVPAASFEARGLKVAVHPLVAAVLENPRARSMLEAVACWLLNAGQPAGAGGGRGATGVSGVGAVTGVGVHTCPVEGHVLQGV